MKRLILPLRALAAVAADPAANVAVFARPGEGQQRGGDVSHLQPRGER